MLGGGWLALINGAAEDESTPLLLLVPLTVIMMLLWIPATAFNAVTFPFACLADVEIFELDGQCTFDNPIGIANILSLLTFFIFTFIGYAFVPNHTGVPVLYRIIAFFVRTPRRFERDVQRATDSEHSPTFNADGLFRRMNRRPTNPYDEILEREDLQRAAKTARARGAQFSKREAELRRKQAEKLAAAKELAEAIEEVERKKARLDELNKKR